MRCTEIEIGGSGAGNKSCYGGLPGMKKAAIINPELLFINGHGFVNIDELAPVGRPQFVR